MSPVVWLIVLGVLFLATHFVMSHPPVRGPLVARLGNNGYLVAYSLVSTVLWVPFVWIWWTDRHSGGVLWSFRSAGVLRTSELIAVVGIGLTVAGVVWPAANSISTRHKTVGRIGGMIHLTRHPVMMGTLLLCLAHLVPLGFTSDVVFWGVHAILAVGGAAHQDQRLRVSRPGYDAYMAATTFFPNPMGVLRIGPATAVVFVVGGLFAVAIRYGHRFF